MSSENLIIGKDCMVQAVVSVTGRSDVVPGLNTLRSKQIVRLEGKKLNPEIEAKNLSSLFRRIKEKHQIQVVQVGKVADIHKLAEARDQDVFVGFAAGTDSPPHIAHLGKRVSEGFLSNQQFTPNRVLSQQLDEQGQITLFIRKNSGYADNE